MMTQAGISTRARLGAYLNLPHPWAVLIVMVATALFGLLATGGQPEPGRFTLLLIAMLGGQIAIGALNDYQDRALDARDKPERPIPSGRVSPRAALGVTAGGLVAMLLAGALLGPLPLLLVTIGTGAGLLYDLWLKRTRWSWLPYLVALPLLPSWVWLSLERFEPRLLLLYALGAPLALAVHLAQSLPDAESDRRSGVQSLVAVLGRRAAFAVILTCSLVTALLVALFGLVIAERAGPALATSALAAGVVALTAFARRRDPRAIDRHLFKVMTILAVLLGAGWVIAVGV